MSILKSGLFRGLRPRVFVLWSIALVFLCTGAALAYAGGDVLHKLRRWQIRRVGDAEARVIMAAATSQQAHDAAGAVTDTGAHLGANALVNTMVPDIAFTDLSGKAGSLSEYRGKILVVSMTSIGCPISKKAVPALGRLAREFGDGRVEFLLFNPDPGCPRAELETHAEQLPEWRYVNDAEAKLARALSARTTTETFIIDESQTLRYRGALDDRFAVGSVRQSQDFNDYLRDALRTVLNHQKQHHQVTEAPGCVLQLEPLKEADSAVTYFKHIARFTQANCVECHRPGEAAPFALETYEQVVAKKGMIEYVLEDKIMPPWFADPKYGHWRNARIVSEADRLMFSEWVKAGCPKGNPDDAPTPLTWSTGWCISEPDIVIQMEPQQIPAEGFVEWRIVPADFEVKEDMWIAEAEIRPSAPEVVHHAMLFIEYADDDPRKRTQTRGESGSTGGSEGYWLSYFPGRKCMILPQGRGKLIPRHGRILVQMHYNPNGTPVEDTTRIGLKLLPAPPEREVISGGIVKGDFAIAPNSRPEFVYSKLFTEDVRLVALMPHMHSRGASASVYLKHADGRIETLLDVPRYDFDWQISYEYEEPMLVTKGSRIVIRHSYDNTPENPDNPDPTQEVRHGNATSDEMMINFFEWEPAGNEPATANENRPFQ